MYVCVHARAGGGDVTADARVLSQSENAKVRVRCVRSHGVADREAALPGVVVVYPAAAHVDGRWESNREFGELSSTLFQPAGRVCVPQHRQQIDTVGQTFRVGPVDCCGVSCVATGLLNRGGVCCESIKTRRIQFDQHMPMLKLITFKTSRPHWKLLNCIGCLKMCKPDRLNGLTLCI